MEEKVREKEELLIVGFRVAYGLTRDLLVITRAILWNRTSVREGGDEVTHWLGPLQGNLLTGPTSHLHKLRKTH